MNNLPITAIIIDDEINSISVICHMIKEVDPDIQIVGNARNVDEGVTLINQFQPNIVFLDIEMPGQNGFDLLDRFTNPNFKVIFITGFSEYAIKAIRYSALDYLLKPLDKQDLSVAISKTIEQLTKSYDRLEDFKELLKQDEPNFIILPSKHGYQKVILEDVMYIEAKMGNYAIFNLENSKKIVATNALSYYEDLLPEKKFFRAHRSHIVNVTKISHLNLASNTIQLRNSESLNFSVRKKNKLKSLFRNNA